MKKGVYVMESREERETMYPILDAIERLQWELDKESGVTTLIIKGDRKQIRAIKGEVPQRIRCRDGVETLQTAMGDVILGVV